ncbi:MAG: pentapeptide repeat-containing protein [Polyangiaceae bacterium]|nr:pentapeptide repeat-containing protein [Polyangiaceae bacterium]
MAGTFDDAWVEQTWPYLPSDTNWAHEQHAPRAQQLPYLRGDEPFEIRGMDAQNPVFEGFLPGVKPRAFVQKASDSGGDFFEIRLHLDTAHFDMEEKRLDLVWRGLVPVVDEEASDIAAWYVETADLTAPKEPVADVEGRFLAKHVRFEVWPALPETPANDKADETDTVGEVVRSTQVGHGLNPSDTGMEGLVDITEDPPLHREPEAPVSLESTSFEGQDLRGQNFANLDLKKRSFARANLTGVSFRKANLDECDFTGAILSEADLSGCSAVGAIFLYADLTRADVRRSRFDNAHMDGVVASHLKGQNASFRGAKAERARFVEARLNSSCFDGARLPSADFTRAVLDKASFQGCHLQSARFYDARGVSAVFKKGDLTDVRADGATLSGCSFALAKAAQSTWEGAVLDRATFLGAQLNKAGLGNVSGTATVFSGADLTSAVLDAAKLEGASFLKANLMEASLEGANLTKADLRAANLHGAALWRTNLRGAQLELAITTATKLERRK